MGNNLRFVGLSSGLDTQSVVESLLSPYQSKIDTIKGKTTKAEWKKDAYKEMSLKLTNFRTKTLNMIKGNGLASKVNVAMSQQGVIRIDNNQNAKQGSFKVKVNQVAEAARVNTKVIQSKKGTAAQVTTVAIGTGDTEKKLTSSSKLNEIEGMASRGNFTINGVEISFDENTTIAKLQEEVNNKLNEAGEDISFKFDESTSSFLIKSNTRGAEQNIVLDDNGSGVFTTMGIQQKDGAYSYSGSNDDDGSKLTIKSRMSEIQGMAESGQITINGKVIKYGPKTTIEEFQNNVMNTLKQDGSDINFTFDEAISAFHIYSNKTGANEKNKITIEGAQAETLGITEVGITKEGKNAKITYNDSLELESESNAMEVNGTKFTVLEESTSDVRVDIQKDIDSVVETIKAFINEYNTLLEDMTKKYNADSASKYSMLTDEKKEAMTDKEVEAWEDKIKNSLFRRDETLSDIISTFRTTLTGSYKGTSGVKDEYSMLAGIGIGSNSWTEQGKLSIKKESTLRTALENDFDAVVSLFNNMANKLDTELYNRSKRNDNRSYGQFFNDKLITSDLSQYAKDLINAQEKYDKMETYYYKKFTAMETAMNQANSQSSLFSSL